MKEQPPAGSCSILLCESVQIMFDFTIYKIADDSCIKVIFRYKLRQHRTDHFNISDLFSFFGDFQRFLLLSESQDSMFGSFLSGRAEYPVRNHKDLTAQRRLEAERMNSQTSVTPQPPARYLRRIVTSLRSIEPSLLTSEFASLMVTFRMHRKSIQKHVHSVQSVFIISRENCFVNHFCKWFSAVFADNAYL